MNNSFRHKELEIDEEINDHTIQKIQNDLNSKPLQNQQLQDEELKIPTKLQKPNDNKIKIKNHQLFPNKITKKSKWISKTGVFLSKAKKSIQIEIPIKTKITNIALTPIFKTTLNEMNVLPSDLKNVLVPIYAFSETKEEEEFDYQFRNKQNNKVNFNISSNAITIPEICEPKKCIKTSIKKIQTFWSKKSLNFPVCFQRNYCFANEKNSKNGIYVEFTDYSGKIINNGSLIEEEEE